MLKKENGSVTLIVLATILFIFAVLATNLVYVSAKRKSQIQESMILQNAYNPGMSETYYEQVEKLKAKTSQVFDSIGNIERYTVTVSGVYLLEVYGAQGGNVTINDKTYTGGNGGYSKGIIKLEKGQTLYIHVGEKGTDKIINEENQIENEDEDVNAGEGKATYISIQEDSNLINSTDGLLIVANGGGGAASTRNGEANNGEKFKNENSGYVKNLENSEIEDGVRSGDGYAKITLYE